ncbi:hypothetical protein LP420_18105 [Massilia sp. B-10]|nr:hypothetical protein LP420_18105 [Massilia sp. B-10]
MRRLLQLGAGAALLLLAAGARADALADLKTALARTAVQAPLRAAIESQTWRKLGEGADADEDSGQASVLAEDGPRGLSLTHAREMVARMERELQARARNPNSKTPTMAALEEMGPHDVLALTCASAALSRARTGRVQGRARRYLAGQAGARAQLRDAGLHPQRPRTQVREKFSSLLDVWIAPDGTPLASRARVSATGRAFIVIGFAFGSEEDSVFGVADERLVTLRKETRTHFSGPGRARRAQSRHDPAAEELRPGRTVVTARQCSKKYHWR